MLFGRKEYLFMISHIRSNSTLLSHILGSNIQITGHSEMHLSYRRSTDLLKLRFKVSRFNNINSNNRFLLDKILSDNHVISDEILTNPNVHILLMLRKPLATFRSIMNMGLTMVMEDWYEDPMQILNYYKRRLNTMTDYALKVGKNGIFIESEMIINNSEYVLDSLSDWLGLEEKLRSNYSVFGDTGVPYFGDPSNYIKKGCIVKKKQNYDYINIPEEILEQADEVYQNCKNALKKNCISL